MNPPRRIYLAQTRLDSPLGPLTATCTEAGLAGLWFDAQAHHPGELQAPLRGHPHLEATAQVLDHYWQSGMIDLQRARGSTLPLDPGGTAFQQAVWGQLLRIPQGQTWRYGELAERLGKPGAARAVGAAVGRNPISVLVPCHRVLGAGGQLTGYAGGLERKRALLRLEGVASVTL